MKCIFPIALLLCCSILVRGQQNYGRLNVGYGFPVAAQKFGEHHTYASYSNRDSFEGVYGSLGSGFSVQAGYGKAVKGGLGWDLEIGYLWGSPVEVETNVPGDEVGVTSHRAKGISFVPSLTLSAAEGRWVPYARVGPVLGSYRIFYQEEYRLSDRVDFLYEEEYYGGVALGFKGSLGLVVNTGKVVQFFTEINFTSLSYAPRKGEIVKFTLDGESNLDFLSSEEKSFRFEDTLEYVNGDSENYNRMKAPLPLSSLSIQAGIRISQLTLSLKKSSH